MANRDNQRIAPPIPFLTAVWAGMSHEDILSGLRAGDIVRPERLPDWAAGLDAPPPAATSRGERSNGAPMVDRARVGAWFACLDPDLTPAAFDAIWSHAGPDDAARASSLTSYLSRALLQHGGQSWSPDARRGGTDAAARLDAYLTHGAHHATVVDLAGKTGEQLAALAKTDKGYRYALANLDHIALSGNDALVGPANADGTLDRSSANSGEEAVSDAWLADRGKFLAWKLTEGSGESMAVAGNQDWSFIDRGAKGADGKPLTFDLKTGSSNAGHNQVVFGTNEDEVFKGVSGTDRIYAGGGDDVLRGGAGGDRLEAGSGDDLAMGGAGNDEVMGGAGNDELDGGRGDDRLDGGVGDDTYVIDSGDGADTVVDADGIGTIELDGDALRGTMQADNGKWRSADQNAEFAFTGNLATGGTLTISTFAEGAAHDGPASNTITVTDWKNGDLGITLDGQDQAEGSEESVDGPSGSEAAPEHSGDVNTDTWADQGSLNLDGDGVTDSASSPSAAQAVSDGESGPSPQSPSYAAGEGGIETQFDYDAALDSLLGSSSDQAFQPLDPATYQQAVNAFSGILEPPDVSASGNNFDAAEFGTVTEAAMADALAGDYSSDAFDSFEPTHAQAIASVDVASMMEQKRAGLEVRSRASA